MSFLVSLFIAILYKPAQKKQKKNDRKNPVVYVPNCRSGAGYISTAPISTSESFSTVIGPDMVTLTSLSKPP